MSLCSYLMPIIAIQFHMEKGGRKSASRETVLCYLPKQCPRLFMKETEEAACL